MRSAVIALVAFALINPAVVSAAAPVQANSSQVAVKKAGWKSSARKVRKSKAAKAKSNNPEVARAGDAASQGRTLPPCASPQSADTARRCLNLAQPAPPPPAQVLNFSASLAEAAPQVQFGGPSRSWVGGFSKPLVNALIRIVEDRYADTGDRREGMTADIQSELQRAHLREQE
jgi:hypothetical protein